MPGVCWVFVAGLRVIALGFKITDGGPRDLAYIYVEENDVIAGASERLTLAEGEEFAQRLARILDDEAGLTEG